MNAEKRLKIFVQTLSVGLMFMLSGLVYVQLIRHAVYRDMSEGNRLRVTPLMASRGAVYDRNGDILVKDVLSFNASVIHSRVKDVKALAGVLNAVCGVPEHESEACIRKSGARPYSPVCVVPDIGIKEAIQLEEIESDYPGLILQVSTKRRYIAGKKGANVLGHLGPINSSEFKRLKHYGYRINDLVGRDGIEKSYDNYLRGIHGGKQVEVDHLGREIRTLGYREPAPGRDVHLTIDLGLQEFCDGLLDGKRGAIVAMDADNGALLAMASAPSYDPEIFIDRRRSDEVGPLLNDREYPLINRAVSGAYPPGSVFKLIVAAGALETGKAVPETSAVCRGIFRLGRATYHCWRKNGHGEQNMTEAIKNSCNIYFYRLGLLLGVEDIARFAGKFGFGERTGIDLPNEAKGTVPTQKWKKDRFRERWYKGETVNYAIGQGYLLVTPVQIARMMSVFANKGYLVRPHLVKRIGNIRVNDDDGIKLDISPGTLDTVRKGLTECVNGDRGTGVKARLSGIVVSGKTGTAQTSRKKSHGWFAGFAPFDRAKLVVVVFDEYGGKGGYYAAETAAEVFREALRLGIL
ncbi:MAG: penicillin-binding protein 2 [Candidatus Omnitrophica bacterium]|nr:penicillin-binding protein 2 [Candidatus Omnitrophota bacterium]